MRKSITGWIGALATLALVASSTPAVAQVVYTTAMSGGIEVPPNASPGTGFAILTYDPFARTMRVQATFSGLLGATTAAHIHCCTASSFPANIDETAIPATQVPTFTLFPLGVTAGVFDQTFDLTSATSWNATFITNNGGTTAGAEAAFVAGLNSQRAYFNIHTNVATGGEIRGFFAVVPEPSTYVLMALGLAGLAVVSARRGSLRS